MVHAYQNCTKKKRKGISLKVNSSREEYQDSSNSEEDVENFNLIVRKFGKFLRKSKDKKFSKSSKKVDNNNNYTCFECGKQGHIKSECPIYLRKHGGEKKGRKKENKRKPIQHGKKVHQQLPTLQMMKKLLTCA